MSDTLAVYCFECDAYPDSVTYESTASGSLVITCGDCGVSEVKRD